MQSQLLQLRRPKSAHAPQTTRHAPQTTRTWVAVPSAAEDVRYWVSKLPTTWRQRLQCQKLKNAKDKTISQSATYTEASNKVFSVECSVHSTQANLYLQKVLEGYHRIQVHEYQAARMRGGGGVSDRRQDTKPNTLVCNAALRASELRVHIN